MSVTNAGGFRVNPSEDSLIIRVWQSSEKQDYVVREGALRERERGEGQGMGAGGIFWNGVSF